jgi:chitosanase
MMARWIRSMTAAMVAACVLCGAASADPLTATQRRVADELVSVFENSTPHLQYGYIENLHDGCGLTAGRAGFCSATGDMLMTVQAYADADPQAPLVRYLPVLRARAAARSARTSGLGQDFVADWRQAAQHAAFRTVQDQIVDLLYYTPATAMAAAARLQTPLAIAIFYDTAIQHGIEKDPDGLPSLIDRTRRRLHALPGRVVSERRWLATFLRVRRADLLHPHNRARRVDWPESAGRVDALASLLGHGHTGLTPPLRVNPWHDTSPFVLR